jgi:membrane protein DedA with SNARE-associated domain
MPPELIVFISHYGYLAIFLVVIAQEMGIPNPVPNELVLMFSGFLVFKGILSLPIVILVTVLADFIGTNVLYFAFYYFGAYLLKHKPRWLPISQKTIDKLSARISSGGQWAIYVGRITPLIRGYTSVITGLLQIKPRIFIPIAVISATTWSLVCVILGRILGPYFNYSVSGMGNVKYIILIAISTVIVIIFLVKLIQKRTALKKEQDLLR